MNQFDIFTSFATPISFRDIGKYMGTDLIPPLPFGGILGSKTYNTFTIPFDNLQNHIQEILSNIEGVRFKWNQPHRVWNIEFGTTPLEKGKADFEFRQIRHGKHCAWLAAQKANDMFPHLINYEDTWMDIVDWNSEESARWAKLELRLYNAEQNKITVHLNRMTGDRTANFVIWNKINEYLKRKALFWARFPILAISDAITDEDAKKIKCRFIIDEFQLRELCSYIGSI